MRYWVTPRQIEDLLNAGSAGLEDIRREPSRRLSISPDRRAGQVEAARLQSHILIGDPKCSRGRNGAPFHRPERAYLAGAALQSPTRASGSTTSSTSSICLTSPENSCPSYPLETRKAKRLLRRVIDS